MCIFTRICYQCNTYMCKTCPNMLHKYVLFRHVYVAGIRWNYTLRKYVLFRHLYVPDICCNHTFYFNVYTLRIYVAIIRCDYTLCFDMYTLQLYAAIIRSALYAYMCIFARIRYLLRSRIRAHTVQYTLLNTEVSCTYMLSLQSTYTCFHGANTLQEYVGFRHIYAATIRCNYTLNICDN